MHVKFDRHQIIASANGQCAQNGSTRNRQYYNSNKSKIDKKFKYGSMCKRTRIKKFDAI